MIFYVPFAMSFAGVVELLHASSWLQFAAGLAITLIGLAFYLVTALAGFLSTKGTQPVNNHYHLPDWINESVPTDK